MPYSVAEMAFGPPAEAPLVDVFQEAEMLRKVPFFGDWIRPSLLLAFTSRAVKFGPGELLMTRGDPPDSVYVIIEGEVEIVGETPAGEFIVAVVGRNELQGEMGVIQNTPRGATVRARTAVRALRIAADVFLRLLTENPGCALHVMRELSARVVAGNTRVATALRDVETLKAQLRANTNVVGDRAPS
jgi:CRP-like cAMP-binding protein